jgi:hypothetical protein
LEVDEKGEMKKEVKNLFSLEKIILNLFSDKLAPEQEKAADVNNDGVLNIFDTGVFKKTLLQEAWKIIADKQKKGKMYNVQCVRIMKSLFFTQS